MDFVPFGGREFWQLLGLMLVTRGSDLLSTWIATPNLRLEANPIARHLGWRWGIPLNLGLCVAFALWPLPAIIIATTSVLVAARNFQSAWIIRSLGEHHYRHWLAERVQTTPSALYVFCLGAQALLLGSVGWALVTYARTLVPFAIGVGIITYALAVVIFTLLSLWHLRRAGP